MLKPNLTMMLENYSLYSYLKMDAKFSREWLLTNTTAYTMEAS
jgi:hypothetical protein